jgi:hypothetical protein
MSRRSIVLLIAAVHLVASVTLTVATYCLGMARFDTGAPPTSAERVIEACAQVLRFPVVTGASSAGLRFPGPTGYLPFILNSLVWAVVASVLLRPLCKLGRFLAFQRA